MLGDEVLQLLFVPAIFLDFTFRAFIERRGGEVEVALLDDGAHAAEEQGHKQGGDVCPVYVGIGHDDNLVIGQFREVCLLGVVLGSDGHTQCAEYVGNLL